MSGSPGQFRARELEIVRVLLDKHLLDRAVNLAEARWTGSGEMVRLAYRWQDLNPAERRGELERIGPEQLAQFRTLAALDPDLAAVLDTLEQRGVLPASLTQGGPPVPAAPQASVETTPSRVEPQRTAAPNPPDDPPIAEAEPVESEPLIPDELRERVERLSDEMLAAAGAGVTAAEVTYTAGSKQRAEAVQRGEELLERVRARLTTTARQTTSNTIGMRPPTPGPSTLIPGRWAPQSVDEVTTLVDGQSRFAPPPEYWINRVRDEPVIVVGGDVDPPSDDQLVALANEFDLEMSEFALEAGTVRATFGGLKRSGAAVDVVVGPLPSALARPNLVVVRGRLYPKIEERLRRGLCDIPGTRASVRVDPRARLIVLP